MDKHLINRLLEEFVLQFSRLTMKLVLYRLHRYAV